MSKFFVRSLFVIMASVMVVTACGTATPEAYANPQAYAGPGGETQAALPTASAEPSAATEAPLATVPPAALTEVSFLADILPIMENSCVSCHGGKRTEKGLDLSSYAALMNGSEKGAVVIAGDADNSALAALVANGKMPKRGSKLTPEQIALIIAWINAGAPNN